MSEDIIVLKFGSSVLRAREHLPHAVHEIYRWYRGGSRVVAVVSAIGEATNQLLAEALTLNGTPEPYATAELLATGERASAALLAIALDRSGVPARVLNPREIGLTVAGSALDSELTSVDVERIRSLLREHPVLVVPGFFGTDPAGRTHVLGRGGSDLTAVFLAQALAAKRCRLIKDVDGVYESDPAAAEGARPKRFSALSYGEAIKVAAPLIQPKAISFLRQHRTHAEVSACALDDESRVHGGATRLADPVPIEPSRVLLLGLGTVGLGVYHCLKSQPLHFQVIGALVRDRVRYEGLQVPAGLLRTRVDQALRLRADIVVDALPGVEPSRQIAEHFLKSGARVISAGKTLIAEHGARLSLLAEQSRASLSYSAAVGGAAPMLEAVERVAARTGVNSIAAVLNATCNFVLNRCSRGTTLEEALADASRAGLAEEDSAEDLTGRDAARKLCILSRHAFGMETTEVVVEPLDERVARRASTVAASGATLRQVARAAVRGGRVSASVRFEEVASDGVLGRLNGEWNALEILSEDGARQVVTGRGAGRWPTTEAIMADLFHAHREICRSRPRTA